MLIESQTQRRSEAKRHIQILPSRQSMYLTSKPSRLKAGPGLQMMMIIMIMIMIMMAFRHIPTMTKTHHDDDDDDDDYDDDDDDDDNLTGACGWHLLPGNCSLKGLQSPSSGCQRFHQWLYCLLFIVNSKRVSGKCV